MSAKRLKWSGLACIGLSALVAGLGFVAQIMIVLAMILFVSILIPVSPIGNLPPGANTLPIPRVLEPSLWVAAFLFLIGVACLARARWRVVRLG